MKISWNVLRLVLSVGAKRRPRIDMSSVEWFSKLKRFKILLFRVSLIFIVQVNFMFEICHMFTKFVVKLSGSFTNIYGVTFLQEIQWMILEDEQVSLDLVVNDLLPLVKVVAGLM